MKKLEKKDNESFVYLQAEWKSVTIYTVALNNLTGK